MEKRTLYPKTKRVLFKNRVVITEKLDGSNIGFFKVKGELLIAQRNYIFKMSEAEENKGMLYQGLLRLVTRTWPRLNRQIDGR
jgi:hypothetical protein